MKLKKPVLSYMLFVLLLIGCSKDNDRTIDAGILLVDVSGIAKADVIWATDDPKKANLVLGSWLIEPPSANIPKVGTVIDKLEFKQTVVSKPDYYLVLYSMNKADLTIKTICFVRDGRVLGVNDSKDQAIRADELVGQLKSRIKSEPMRQP